MAKKSSFPMPTQGEVFVNQKQMAHWATTSVETIKGYEERGVIKREENGTYDLMLCLEQIHADLRNKSGGRAGIGEASLASERAGLAKEQRDSVAFKNAIARGEYVRVADVRREHETRLIIHRDHLLALPGKLSHEMEMRPRVEIEKIFREGVCEALDDLSHPSFWDSRRSAPLH